MIEEIDKFWKEYLHDFEPLAHELKLAFKDRWVRFHSLPESKRYPESELEYKEIFSRYDTVLLELGGTSSRMFVVLPEYSENNTALHPADGLRSLFPHSEYWRTIDKLEECGVYWHLHVTEIQIPNEKLNALFRLVANDEVRNILVVLPEVRSVFHPYDGGADIIASSEEAKEELKNKYKAWLSKHPRGY
ncbi:hypothetical protein HRH59_03610 [Rheinheimera sp. YQF-2]|uniref:DUF3885 domain-containing protein n=1 Tax=Rheinheimera lutimaris TaxID=2740584 RepID=A0A7Y5EHV5_9GAMM|nr:hypothetical protein [Rheinheimera lutimaris]NRQ41656.1 hypothetical protein [Rheinheimera lutimaris]